MTGLADMRADYERVILGTMDWIRSRPPLGDGFVNTKLNPITLRDYGPDDGYRGPDFIYGWIQGRALEAITRQIGFIGHREDGLARHLEGAAQRLETGLAGLVDRDGHAYFCYDAARRPIVLADSAPPSAQARPPDIFTFSDIFAAKGLVAAAAKRGMPGLDRRLALLSACVAAVEDERFQIDERRVLCHGAIAQQPDDFGPRMILLGAAEMLTAVGCAGHAGFALRLIADVLRKHYDAPSGLLRNTPDGTVSNVGHAIEFVGFALACLPEGADPGLLDTLRRILVRSFAAGFTGHGLGLEVRVSDGAATTGLCPWWSLPETVRAAALMYERTHDAEVLRLWATAHSAFFADFWRDKPPIAWQMRNADGPVDRVPATPDLDPGYHTGLSFRAALDVIDRMKSG